MAKANTTIDLSKGFYKSESVPFSNQRCVNLFVNIPEADALTPSSLFHTEGLVEALSTGSNRLDANRGSIEFQKDAIFVNGKFMWRIQQSTAPDGTITYSESFIGEVGGESGRVSMAENGNQVIVINDVGIGFIYEPAASPAFSQIDDAGFYANGTPRKVRYVDRYFLVTTDDKKAIISAVGDGKNWNAVDFISAEADPDEITGIFVFKNQPYLLGTRTTEQFQNIGGAGVPFRRVNGFILDVGCSAPDSVVNVGASVMWIGRGQNEKVSVWLFTGSEPQKVSTTAIDNELHKLTQEQLENIFSYAYTQRGNTFVHFTTPFSTFVFNSSTNRWHECESEITEASGRRKTYPRRISSVVDVFNTLLVGDSYDGRVGIINADVLTEYDEPLISWFTTQPLYNRGTAFTIPSIELMCETGVGTVDIPSPKVSMAISRDGVVWENYRTRELGAQGNRAIRPIWYKNGRVSKLAVLKFRISDAVVRRLYSVELNLKGGQ